MNNSVCVYFRMGDWCDMDEFDSCSHHLYTVDSRSKIPYGSLVVPRYSALPFYTELEKDVKNNNSYLINTFQQHSFVADLTNYYQYIEDLTPKTWNTWGNLPEGSYVVKGSTNSRKHEWNRRMFARTRRDIPAIVSSLLDDDLIKTQGIIVREYVPLKTFSVGINGLPITNEWRFFCLRGEPIIGGYYWSSSVDPSITDPQTPPPEAWNLARIVCDRVGSRIPFFVVDVAQKENGGWIVIELNDAQQSGLSMIDPEKFYNLLRIKLTE